MRNDMTTEESKYLRAIIVSVNIKSIRCEINEDIIDPKEFERKTKNGLFFHSFERWAMGKRYFKNSDKSYFVDPVKATFKLKDNALYDKALSFLNRTVVLEIQYGIIISITLATYRKPESIIKNPKPQHSELDDLFWSK
jgi:hypothetical protein